MMLVVMSVYDRAAGAYGRPVFAVAEGAAVRSFSNEVNRVGQDNDMHNHPRDFDLFVLGTFADDTGKFVLLDSPRLVVNGGSVLAKV